jgi:hypothetical protein
MGHERDRFLSASNSLPLDSWSGLKAGAPTVGRPRLTRINVATAFGLGQSFHTPLSLAALGDWNANGLAAKGGWTLGTCLSYWPFGTTVML